MKMTETDLKALDLLFRAYHEDTPVHLAGQTRRRKDGDITVNRTAASMLVGLGVARYTRPAGRFLLLTFHGYQVANARAPKVPAT